MQATSLAARAQAAPANLILRAIPKTGEKVPAIGHGTFLTFDTNPDHQTENIGALRGPLPDPAMRTRMVKYMETFPGFDKLAEMPPYSGKTFLGVVKH